MVKVISRGRLGTLTQKGDTSLVVITLSSVKLGAEAVFQFNISDLGRALDMFTIIEESCTWFEIHKDS